MQRAGCAQTQIQQMRTPILICMMTLIIIILSKRESQQTSRRQHGEICMLSWSPTASHLFPSSPYRSTQIDNVPTFILYSAEQANPDIFGTSSKLFTMERVRKHTGKRLFQGFDNNAVRKPASLSHKLCEKWAVITTIFEPSKLVKQLGKLEDWCTVVVGDKKTPPSFSSLSSPRLVYLSPDDQRALPYKIVSLLPWNHFGRKNVGFLFAIHHGAETIYDVDDDNIFLEDKMTLFDEKPTHQVQSKSSVFNVYSCFQQRDQGAYGVSSPSFSWPRGFPLDLISDPATSRCGDNVLVAEQKERPSIGVLQSLANNDPDIDAIYRLTRPLPFSFDETNLQVVLPPGLMTPYNAQATMHFSKAFWGMLLPITVHGRVSDIWRSYWTQRLLWDVDLRLAFSNPWVLQDRNPHSYLGDFKAEEHLYHRSGALVKYLLEWQHEAKSVPEALELLYIDIYEHGVIELPDVELLQAWIQDLVAVGYQFPELKE